MRPFLSLAAIAAGILSAGSAAGQPAEAAEARLARAEAAIPALGGQVQQLERLYLAETDKGELDALERRFSDAEVQFLLGEWANASVLLYDLVEAPRFRTSGKLPDARYYLAEALFQQGNAIGARRYFRDLVLGRQGRYLDQGLKRYLELCGKLRDFSGIDEVVDAARQALGGSRPELAYVLGKWTFRRADLPDVERLRAAEALFLPLVGGPFGARASYLLGVIAVQRGQLDGAIARFEATARAARDDEAELRELANLSLGRVLHEQGRWLEAIDRYQEVSRTSASFDEALYEIAWTYVRMRSFDQALRTVDLLLLVVAGTPLEPEAKVLQAHLFLELGRYAEAEETYAEVATTWGPVRTDIDAMLASHADPVAYFDHLLSSQRATVDADELLPPKAMKWASTQLEVENAVRVVRDLEESRRGLAESREVAQRLLGNLGDGKALEATPALAEGLALAEAAEARALATERELLLVEAQLLGGSVPGELTAVRQELAALEARFAKLPRSPEDVDARRARMERRLAQAESAVYKAGQLVQSIDAQIQAIKKWLADTKGTRRSDPQGEARFALDLQAEIDGALALRAEYEGLRRRLGDELAALGAGGGNAAEAELRRRYEALLVRERELSQRARAGLPQPLFARIDRVHRQIDEAKVRLLAARAKIRGLADRKGAEVREAVAEELDRLAAYEREAAEAGGSARGLVGRIAFDSFQRVRGNFDDLLIKADVGILDVAWKKKRDKSEAIQKLAQEKDRDVGELDADLRDVLKEEP